MTRMLKEMKSWNQFKGLAVLILLIILYLPLNVLAQP